MNKAIIYLSQDRFHDEQEHWCGEYIFSQGRFQRADRQPAGIIRTLNEISLEPRAVYSLEIPAHTGLLLLPVMGALAFDAADPEEQFLAAGQARILHAAQAQTYALKNPFEEGLVSFLECRFDIPSQQSSPGRATERALVQCTVSYDIREQKNRLIPFPELPEEFSAVKIFIGQFDGRSGEDLPIDPQEHAFLFVIQGAFEIAGRLLHARDALFLETPGLIDLEALSNQAILLCLCFKMEK